MTMKLFAFMCLVASATAFVPAPAARLVARPRVVRAAAPTMSLDALPVADLPAVADSAVAAASSAASTLALATSASDFGGYTFPLVGLLILTGAIVVLAPPVED